MQEGKVVSGEAFQITEKREAKGKGEKPTKFIVLKKVSVHSNPKESKAKECSNYCKIVLISHASKVILQAMP